MSVTDQELISELSDPSLLNSIFKVSYVYGPLTTVSTDTISYFRARVSLVNLHSIQATKFSYDEISFESPYGNAFVGDRAGALMPRKEDIERLVAFGSESMNQGGGQVIDCVGVGFKSLFNLYNSNDIVSIGSQPGAQSVADSNDNVFIGSQVANNISEANNNIIIGSKTGTTWRGGNNNIVIGTKLQLRSANDNNYLNIGNTFVGDTLSNRYSFGSSDIDPNSAFRFFHENQNLVSIETQSGSVGEATGIRLIAKDISSAFIIGTTISTSNTLSRPANALYIENNTGNTRSHGIVMTHDGRMSLRRLTPDDEVSFDISGSARADRLVIRDVKNVSLNTTLSNINNISKIVVTDTDITIGRDTGLLSAGTKAYMNASSLSINNITTWDSITISNNTNSTKFLADGITLLGDNTRISLVSDNFSISNNANLVRLTPNSFSLNDGIRSLNISNTQFLLSNNTNSFKILNNELSISMADANAYVNLSELKITNGTKNATYNVGFVNISDGNNHTNISNTGITISNSADIANLTGKSLNIMNGNNQTNISNSGITISNSADIVNLTGKSLNIMNGSNQTNISNNAINIADSSDTINLSTTEFRINNSSNSSRLTNNMLTLSNNNSVNVATLSNTGFLLNLSADGRITNQITMDQGKNINISDHQGTGSSTYTTISSTGTEFVILAGAPGTAITSRTIIDNNAITLSSSGTTSTLTNTNLNLSSGTSQVRFGILDGITLSNASSRSTLSYGILALSNGSNRIDISSSRITLLSGGDSNIIINNDGSIVSNSLSTNLLQSRTGQSIMLSSNLIGFISGTQGGTNMYMHVLDTDWMRHASTGGTGTISLNGSLRTTDPSHRITSTLMTVNVNSISRDLGSYLFSLSQSIDTLTTSIASQPLRLNIATI